MKKRRLASFLLAFLLLFCACARPGAKTAPADSQTGAGGAADADFSKTEAEMFTDRDRSADYDETKSVKIQLNQDSVSCNSDEVKISGTTVAITREGTYILSGSLDDGTILVDADADKLQLVLDGVSVKSETSAALYIRKADKVFVTLAPGSENTLSNGGSFAAIDENKIDGAVFSKEDLTFNGSGSLTVVSPAGHGIVCKDDLVFTGGSYTVSAASHGLDVNDSVRITAASLAITAGKDGVHSENTDEETLGFFYMLDGALEISAEGDGVSAEAYIQIENGALEIVSGGGSANASKPSSENWGAFPGGGFGGGRIPRERSFATAVTTAASAGSDSSTSIKGVKAAGSILIRGGNFTIDSADDAVHANGSITVAGGSFEIASGDDGFHADETLTVTAGSIRITESYEGLEALHLIISGGDIKLVATDDGLNAAGGTDSSGFGGGRGDLFGGPGGGSSANGTLEISGGSLSIEMGGDGVDSNGSVSITGGSITVSGANSGDTSILDYETTGTIRGGTFIGTGASGMAENFSSSSTQGALMAATGTQSAGTAIKLTDADGNVLVSHTAEREFSCVLISHAALASGGSYTLTVGSSTTSITMNGTVYSSGGMGGFGGGMGGRR